ncbi:MAG TPA: hypothetical protein VFG74_09350 [Miltoncostaeaceae bacterium]|jgi:hypothetical protein|nr:hypothetical protein [Miltoncostaeaceae bacterium]
MATRRLELGFEGGTFLRLTVEDSTASEMTEALKNGSGPQWREVVAEEGTYLIDQSELLYVRLPPREPGRVGFGGE